MELIDRLNLIIDGEPLDGVGDNPDVLNRAIKQLVSILETGDQDTIKVPKIVKNVDSTDFLPTTIDGDAVYLDDNGKYSPVNINNAKRFVGIADKTNEQVITHGEFTITGVTFEVGKLVYLHNANAGKLVSIDDLNQSKFALGIATGVDTLYIFGELIKEDLDTGIIGDVFLDAVQTLTNKTLKDKTNSISADSTHQKIVNRTGTTLTVGTIVSLDGYDDTFETPSIIKSSSSISDKPGFGLVMQDITNNNIGLVLTLGLLENVDVNVYSENELLYVGIVAGTFTNIKPALNSQAIGRVIESSTEGSIFVTLATGVDSDIDFDDYKTDSPSLAGVSSGNENSVIVITRSNNDTEASYFTNITGGTIVDNGDGTISWTLPDVTVDSVYYISEYATRKGELKSDLSTKAVNVISVPVPNPILSGVSNGNENSLIKITIDNYDASAISYNISITDGSFVRNSAVIDWTLPAVIANKNEIMSVSVTTSVGTSGTTDKVVNVVNVPIVGDASISITDFSENEYNDGWNI